MQYPHQNQNKFAWTVSAVCVLILLGGIGVQLGIIPLKLGQPETGEVIDAHELLKELDLKTKPESNTDSSSSPKDSLAQQVDANGMPTGQNPPNGTRQFPSDFANGSIPTEIPRELSQMPASVPPRSPQGSFYPQGVPGRPNTLAHSDPNAINAHHLGENGGITNATYQTQTPTGQIGNQQPRQSAGTYSSHTQLKNAAGSPSTARQSAMLDLMRDPSRRSTSPPAQSVTQSNFQHRSQNQHRSPTIIPGKGFQPSRSEGNREPMTKNYTQTASYSPSTSQYSTPKKSHRDSLGLPQQLMEIEKHLEAKEYVQAHRQLSRLYWVQPAVRSTITDMLDKTSRSIFFDPHPHYLVPYMVKPGDSLGLIAQQYQVPWEYLMKMNRLSDPKAIRPGQELKVNQGPFAAVIELSKMQLTIHAHNYVVRHYPIGIGQDVPTPIGEYTISSEKSNPQYTNPQTGQVIASGNPANPLGSQLISLKGTSLVIHGTNSPQNIGKKVPMGGIHLKNEDVQIVSFLLSSGSKVIVKP